MHSYLATELIASKLDADDDEYITVERIPFDEAISKIESGEIQDGKSIAALLLAARVLGHN